MDMQKILSEISKKGEGVVVAIGGKTKEFAENASMLMKANQAIETEIYELGLAFYEAYKDAKPNSPIRRKFEDRIDYITELLEIKDESKANLAETFGKKYCEECGKVVKSGDMFCSGCGTPVEEDEPEPVIEERKCPNCGAEHSKEQKFCGKCGSKLIK